MPTVDSQSQPYTSTTTNERLCSDSKMTYDRRFEIERKQMDQESARPRAFSAIIDVSGDACEHVCEQNAMCASSSIDREFGNFCTFCIHKYFCKVWNQEGLTLI